MNHGWALAALLLWVLFLIVNGERRIRRESPVQAELRRQVDAKRAREGLPPMDWEAHRSAPTARSTAPSATATGTAGTASRSARCARGSE